MKTRDVLLVGVFAISLLVLMIGVKFGTRASPPLFLGAVPPGAISASEMPAAGAGGRLDYHPPAP